MSKEYVSREFDSRRISVIVHSSASDKLHSFFFMRLLFFRPRLNILIFLPILD